jgi:hypothetical protein
MQAQKEGKPTYDVQRKDGTTKTEASGKREKSITETVVPPELGIRPITKDTTYTYYSKLPPLIKSNNFKKPDKKLGKYKENKCPIPNPQTRYK